MKPIMPWMGGKRRLADRLLPLFPDHKTYVEVFAGGAALFFMKEPSRVEVINDVNGDLINLYRCVQHHLEEFVRQFKWALVSRQLFKWLQATNTPPLTDIQRAARFYYLQRTTFGAKVVGQTFGTAPSQPPRLNLLRIEEELTAAHLRLARTYVENLDWRDCMDRYDRESTFFYLDPPYWQVTGYGHAFDFADYEALAERMRNLKGSAILSVNDHPDMRRVFAGFEVDTVDITHTVGGNKGALRRELIVATSTR